MKLVEMDSPTLCPRCHRELQAGELMAVYGSGRWANILRRCADPCDKQVARGVKSWTVARRNALAKDPPAEAESLASLSFGDSMAKIAESMPSFRRRG